MVTMDELLAKYMLRETSSRENQVLHSWMAASEANQNYYIHFKLSWENSKLLKTESTLSADQTYLEFKELAETLEVEKTSVRKLSGWVILGAFLFVVLSSSVGLYYKHSQQITLSLQTRNRPQNGVFPDGSRVVMNKNAVITYPDDFKRNNRSVELKAGEAFFDVLPDHTRSFSIQVGDLSVSIPKNVSDARRTSINVKHTELNTEIIVERGVAQVSNGKNNLLLNPAEKVTVSAYSGDFAPGKIKDDLYKYYRVNVLTVRQRPLCRVASVLGEIYNVNILVRDKDLGEKRISATFKTDSLEEALRILEKRFKVQVIRNADIIILQ